MKFTLPAILALSTAEAWGGQLVRMGPSPSLLMYSPRIERQRAMMDRAMDRAFRQSSPRYEIIDDETKFQVAVDVPGLKPDDIHVSMEDNVLTIRGSREQTNDNYNFSSRFSQSFSLDNTIEVDKLTADLKDGILVVQAPKDLKQLEDNVRKIPIMYEGKLVKEKEVELPKVAAASEEITEPTKAETLETEPPTDADGKEEILI